MPDLDDATANVALDLALEWAKQWLQPTQARRAIRNPDLDAALLDRYEQLVRDTMPFAFDRAAELGASLGFDTRGYHDTWKRAVLQHSPWVSAQNLGRLASQGMYYALK